MISDGWAVWLGGDVVRWQFDVVGEEEAAKSQDVDDVVVEVVEYDEDQEINKTQEHKNTRTQEQENTEFPPTKGVGGVQENTKIRKSTKTQKYENTKAQNTKKDFISFVLSYFYNLVIIFSSPLNPFSYEGEKYGII